MLDKKQIRAVFLFEFKMGCKAAEAICNINSHLAQELLMNIQCSGGSRSFAKEMRALKMESLMTSHWTLIMTIWEPSSKLILLFSSVQFSHSVMSNSLWPHGLQHARPPCPSPIPGVYPNSCPLSWWCHPTISCSVVPFSSCLQLFPASGSFQMSWFFT